MAIGTGTAMALGSALQFAGGFLGRSGGGKAARQQLHHQLFLDDKAREFNDLWNQKQLDFAGEQFWEQKRVQKNRIRDAVYDAKQAGLHPLFALGANAGTSPVSFMPGQSSSGSAMGAGIRQSAAGAAVKGAGRALQQYAGYRQAKEEREAGREMRQLQLEEQRLRNTSLGWEVYNQQQSALKLAEQDPIREVTPASARGEVAAAGGIPEKFREKETGAWYDWVKMPSGKYKKVLSTEWDEISQVHMLWQMLKDKFDVGPSGPRRGYLRGKAPLRIRIEKAGGGFK